MARRFWWLNGADSNQLQTFLLYSAEYRRFKELALEAIEKFEEERQKRLKQVSKEIFSRLLFKSYLLQAAEDLKAKEEWRAQIAFEVCLAVM